MPVLFEVDRADKWLRKTNIMSIMSIGDQSLHKYFDLFEVSNRILDENVNDRDLLKPIGVSLKQTLFDQNMGNFKTEQEYRERGHRGK